MSGASSSARPLGRLGSGTSWMEPVPVELTLVRARPGRMRSSANQSCSAGLKTSTGLIVVGRMTPERDTSRPMSVLTSVDLPAPVEPPTTASSGASRLARRGST